MALTVCEIAKKTVSEEMGISAVLQMIVEAKPADLEQLYIELGGNDYDPCDDNDFVCPRKVKFVKRTGQDEDEANYVDCEDDIHCPFYIHSFDFEDFYFDLQDRIIAELHIKVGANRKR